MSGHIKTPADIIEFLLIAMNSSDAFKPNYHEIARNAGINSAMNAQRKLKSIAENAGFALVNGGVVRPDGTKPVPAPKPRAWRAKKNSVAPAAKKRKVEEVEGDSPDGDVSDGEEDAGAEEA